MRLRWQVGLAAKQPIEQVWIGSTCGPMAGEMDNVDSNQDGTIVLAPNQEGSSSGEGFTGNN